jgi:hypothetical protein
VRNLTEKCGRIQEGDGEGDENTAKVNPTSAARCAFLLI